MSCCPSWCLSVLWRARGSPGHLSDRPANGASCPPLLLAWTEWYRRIWVSCPKCTVTCFFPRLFLAAAFAVCLRLLAACWWHREAVNGKAPAGLPLCVLSLGKLPLSSCSISFCGSHLVSTIIPSGHGEMCHLEDVRPRSQQVLG